MPFAIPQPVVTQLTRAAVFLVVTVNSGRENEAAVRTLCGDLAALLRSRLPPAGDLHFPAADN
ncbi:MAG: Dyp-type peroxidase domain-containing protein [Bradyrhizobium sp.]